MILVIVNIISAVTLYQTISNNQHWNYTSLIVVNSNSIVLIILAKISQFPNSRNPQIGKEILDSWGFLLSYSEA